MGLWPTKDPTLMALSSLWPSDHGNTWTVSTWLMDKWLAKNLWNSSTKSAKQKLKMMESHQKERSRSPTVKQRTLRSTKSKEELQSKTIHLHDCIQHNFISCYYFFISFTQCRIAHFSHIF